MLSNHPSSDQDRLPPQQLRRQQQRQQQPLPHKPPPRPPSVTATTTTHNSSSSSSGSNIRRVALSMTGVRRTNDDVHSSIQMCPVMCAMVDTPAFQRLRGIRQLGTAEYVYMNCNHTRFEHCIGTSHVSAKLVENIYQKQPCMARTPANQLVPSSSSPAKDVLCVRLAGLLHDIGHGPYSHVYEQFITETLPQFLREHPNRHRSYPYGHLDPLPKGWKHESVSLLMIDLALNQLGLAMDLDQLDQPLRELDATETTTTTTATMLVQARSMRVWKQFNGYNSYNHNDLQNPDESSSNHHEDDLRYILTSRDVVFIKECIWGGPIPEYQTQLGIQGWIGRPHPYQGWLYQVVTNPYSGLDVDKIDYFARDERRAFRASGEIYTRMVEEATVAWAPCAKASSSPHDCPSCCAAAAVLSATNTSTAAAATAANRNIHTHSNSSKRVTQLSQVQPDQEGLGLEASLCLSKHRDEHLMICYPDKMVQSTMEFFKKRFMLHSTIYRHKTVTAAAYMVQDIMCWADPFLLIPTSITTIPNGGRGAATANRSSTTAPLGLPISRAMLDAQAFLRLRDSILDLVEYTTDPHLREAQELRLRLRARDLYKCVGSQALDVDNNRIHARIWKMKETEIRDQLLMIRGRHAVENGSAVAASARPDDPPGMFLELGQDDLIVERCSIHHGQKEKNPVSYMWFLTKTKLIRATEVEDMEDLPVAEAAPESKYQATLPRSFQETTIRVFSRHSHKCDLARHVFEAWWREVSEEMQLTAPPAGEEWGGDNEADAKLPLMLLTQEEADDDDDDDDNDVDGGEQSRGGGGGAYAGGEVNLQDDYYDYDNNLHSPLSNNAMMRPTDTHTTRITPTRPGGSGDRKRKAKP